jgi:hypothetical protein
MRKTSGGEFYSETETGASLAPSAGTDGTACKMGGSGSDSRNADDWTIIATFGGDSTTVDVIPWTYTGGNEKVEGVVTEHENGHWVNGTKYTLKAASDDTGGAKLSIPCDGADRRLYIQVTALDGSSPSVTLRGYHSEHSEVM